MRLRTAIAPIFALAALAAVPLAARDKHADRDPEAQLTKMLAGRTAGAPTECISRYPSMTSTTIERTGIVYQLGSTLYVNRFEGGCPELDTFRILVIRTTSTQLCRGDTAQVLTQPPESTFVSTCTFGKFTPYPRAK